MLKVSIGKFGIRREILNLFTFDLKKEVPSPSRPVAIHEKLVRSELIDEKILKARLGQGDLLFRAEKEGKELGYIFGAVRETGVSEIEAHLIVANDEVYLYDAFVRPEFRGQGIYPELLKAALNYFKGKKRRALIFTTASNRMSRRGIEKAGFFHYQTVIFYNLFGIKFYRFGRKEKHVRSYLKAE